MRMTVAAIDVDAAVRINFQDWFFTTMCGAFQAGTANVL